MEPHLSKEKAASHLQCLPMGVMLLHGITAQGAKPSQHASVLQGYYQEAGRAGRDGKRSECVLLYAARDIPRIVRLLRSGHGRSKAKFDRGFALLNQVQAQHLGSWQCKCPC